MTDTARAASIVEFRTIGTREKAFSALDLQSDRSVDLADEILTVSVAKTIEGFFPHTISIECLSAAFTATEEGMTIIAGPQSGTDLGSAINRELGARCHGSNSSFMRSTGILPNSSSFIRFVAGLSNHWCTVGEAEGGGGETVKSFLRNVKDRRTGRLKCTAPVPARRFGDRGNRMRPTYSSNGSSTGLRSPTCLAQRSDSEVRR